MKTEIANVENMDDLVFENRNKEYGAYVIRKTYTDNLNRALLFVFGSVVVTIALPLVLPLADTESPSALSVKKTIILDEPPLFIVEEVKQKIVSAVQKAIRDIPPVVTTNPEPIVASPIQEAMPGSDEGVVGGEVTVPGDVGVGVEEVASPVVIEAPKVWDRVEVMPQYEGGMEAMIKFLRSKIRYPAIARRMETQGSVFVSFVINTDGSIIQAKVIKGISKECDEEALRVISMMPPWNAGRQGNMPVMVRMVLPIKFQLN